MRKLTVIAGLASLLFLAQCDILESVASDVLSTEGTTGAPSLTNDEVIAGLKEALTIGIKNGAASASAVDGFFKNPKIFIPWPEDAIRLKEWGVKNGFDGKVTEIETTFNRAAYHVCKDTI